MEFQNPTTNNKKNDMNIQSYQQIILHKLAWIL